MLELLARLRAAAEQEFIDGHALHAREDEIAAVRRYERAFACHDRMQRARKLAELEARLADPALALQERSRLQDFRATLKRLADYEEDVRRGIEPPATWPHETVRHWIEQAKLDRALYSMYGGPIGWKPAGAYAHGARSALVRDYLARHALAFDDPVVEHAVLAALQRPPALAVAAPDFTPFWLRPLVASYVPSQRNADPAIAGLPLSPCTEAAPSSARPDVHGSARTP